MIVMETFKFSLQPVLNHRQFIEESLQKEFAHLQRRLTAEQEQLDCQEQQQQQLTFDLEQMQRQATTSSKLLLYVDFLEQLKADIKHQQQIIADLNQQTALKREELLEAMKNRKALEKFKEKKLAQHREQMLSKEQAFLDEIGVNRHGRRQP